jgi:sodium transport system ATP-binding protein
VIEVEGLSKRFGEVVAVSDASFRAEDGAITGLLGPNGAGKTTTLRMMYGLLKPDTGSVRIDGFDGARETLLARRRLGVLPDSHGLYPRLTAREHILYFGRLQGLAETELGTRADRLIEMLDMGGIADRRTEGFSQGERMKVALARALVHEPTNVVLDEPTNGLDVMSTRAMRGQIRELARHGKCVLFSSHVMQEVSALCDVIYIMSEGKVVASGSASELRERAGVETLEDAFVVLTGHEVVADEGHGPEPRAPKGLREPQGAEDPS